MDPGKQIYHEDLWLVILAAVTYFTFIHTQFAKDFLINFLSPIQVLSRSVLLVLILSLLIRSERS